MVKGDKQVSYLEDGGSQILVSSNGNTRMVLRWIFYFEQALKYGRSAFQKVDYEPPPRSTRKPNPQTLDTYLEPYFSYQSRVLSLY